MNLFRVRWSPRKGGWFVIPGDDIVGAKPFRVDWHKLIDPDLFRQASMEHHWPRLPVEHWRDLIKLAVTDKDIADGCPLGMRAQIALLSLALFKDEMTLEDYFETMEKMTP